MMIAAIGNALFWAVIAVIATAVVGFVLGTMIAVVDYLHGRWGRRRRR